jgi:hypothetical protein
MRVNDLYSGHILELIECANKLDMGLKFNS